MIADTIYKYQVEADLIPFRDLLLGVFFVSVGLQIEMQAVIDNAFSAIGLAIIIMLAKMAVIIAKIMSHAPLGTNEYDRINTLMDIQHQLKSINEVFQNLGKELKLLEGKEKTNALAGMAIEGLDLVLLTLKDIAKDYDEEDMKILEIITSKKGKGLARIRESYLSAEKDLDAETKALLLSSINRMDRLKFLFGLIGSNYRKLAISC